MAKYMHDLSELADTIDNDILCIKYEKTRSFKDVMNQEYKYLK